MNRCLRARAILAAFVLLAVCLAPGCGRKAKPEPLRPASRIVINPAT